MRFSYIYFSVCMQPATLSPMHSNWKPHQNVKNWGHGITNKTFHITRLNSSRIQITQPHQHSTLNVAKQSFTLVPSTSVPADVAPQCIHHTTAKRAIHCSVNTGFSFPVVWPVSNGVAEWGVWTENGVDRGQRSGDSGARSVRRNYVCKGHKWRCLDCDSHHVALGLYVTVGWLGLAEPFLWPIAIVG